ncbi:MAG: hypothetical protein GY873_16590, partial [Bosea sp.]|uniref:hypothetical protein n=1 Tax=Bosea sp. (in: a-proteobacteria) TaxID=1871050 RepID=UPI00239A27F2|nr:hypothetical protein [Bosea sp. (in: a-proteobacteria)]
DSFDVLKDLADRMQRVGVNSRTTAEAMVVLGRSGADLTNLLITGSAGLADYESTLKGLGGVMSGQLLDSSEAFVDSMADLDAASQGLKNELAIGLIPTLTFLADVMANRVIPNTRRMIAALGTFKLPAGLKAILRTLPGGGLVDLLGAGSTLAGGLAAGGQAGGFDPQAGAEGLFLAATAPAANGTPGVGGKKAEVVEEHRAVAIDMVAITQEGERLQTQAAVEGIAERLYWKRDELAVSKALKDQAAAEDAARHEEAMQQAWELSNAQTGAASAAFGAVEQFAGMA